MTETLRHRGPNSAGSWLAPHVALGHRRLSIIDLSDAGRQPMASADGRYVICYNGEVYNFRELRAELERVGARFRSRTDTEVVLEVFARWGVAGLCRLNGIFAFAIWDEVEQRLTLVRDRFGIKPLYYDVSISGRIVFGSEMKAVLTAARSSSRLDWTALHEFMHYGTGGLGARTLFATLRKLEPAHLLEFTATSVRCTAYWRLDPAARSNGGDPVESVRALLDAAVRRQLISDVPVGVFLSGGIDSSAIAACAVRHHAGKLQSYAVGFDFATEANELPKAARVAQCLGLDHHELFLRGVDMPEVVELMVRQHDNPFSDAANLPLYLLCRELGGRLRVVLQGDGGDELFAGYRRYPLLAHSRLLAALAPAQRLVGLLPLPRARRRRIERMLGIWGRKDGVEQMALLLAQDYPEPSPLRALGEAVRARAAATDPFGRYREIGAPLQDLDSVQRMLWTDVQILLPDIFLEKVDRATMACGVEARVPFLDHELTDYVLPLPAKVKLRGNQPKALLKAALRGVVPDFVLDAPKMGFAVPYGRWLAGPMASFARERICAGAATADGLIDRRVAEELLAAHTERRDDHGFLLWKLLNLALWYDHHRRHLCLTP